MKIKNPQNLSVCVCVCLSVLMCVRVHVSACVYFGGSPECEVYVLRAGKQHKSLIHIDGWTDRQTDRLTIL